MRDWKGRRVTILLVILLGTAFLMSGCQSISKKLDYENCTTKGEPSQFWAKYNLPKVKGAQLCSDYAVKKGRAISFIHYHEGDKNLTDFSKPYEDEFKKNGWEIEDYTSLKYSMRTYVSKEGDKFFVEFIDCYEGRDFSNHRPCISVTITQTDDVVKPKK